MKEDTLSSTPMAQRSSLYVIAERLGEERWDYIHERRLLRDDRRGKTWVQVQVSMGWEGGNKKKEARTFALVTRYCNYLSVMET